MSQHNKGNLQQQPTTNINLNGEETQMNSTKVKKKTKLSTLFISVNIVFDVLASIIRAGDQQDINR